MIVDDEKEMCLSLSEILSANGYCSLFYTEPEKALEYLKKETPDLILTDYRMPGIGGLELLQNISEMNRKIPVVMISGFGSVDAVVQAMKYGALNFYEKPLDIETLLQEIAEFFARKKESVSQEKREIYLRSQNPRMQEIFKIIEMAAPTNAPVIITGESGTGKEFIASAIHNLSERKNKPYLKMNCAAIPDNLLESELFGYEQGAFTDARKSKKGKFELANGGSLFFDEIGDMSLNTQSKLLRILQEQEFEKLGGTEVIKTDVRFICATNKNFQNLIDRNLFRSDLYYRISVISIQLPPLRERREDIPALCAYYIDIFNRQYQKNVKALSSAVEAFFLTHCWPGNIRELKNVLERSVIFCQGDYIESSHLPRQYQQDVNSCEEMDNPDRNKLEGLYNSLSRQVIVDALEQSGWSRQKAAETLNIHRKTLYNRMKKYGISLPE